MRHGGAQAPWHDCPSGEFIYTLSTYEWRPNDGLFTLTLSSQDEECLRPGDVGDENLAQEIVGSHVGVGEIQVLTGVRVLGDGLGSLAKEGLKGVIGVGVGA